MTMQEMAALWPYDITDFSKGKATYAQQTVTVARVVNNAQGVGLKFQEDTTPDGEYVGVFWNVEGGWDNETDRSTKYSGPIPKGGEQLTVTLAAKPRDNGGYFRDCKIASEAS